MQSAEIRKTFLKFFKEKEHTIVPSSSLIPSDPSVLFTTAGMQQFKPYYTGEKDALSDFGLKNTASVQKCFRTSDIEEIGDETHLTFFEMLGNFSFGGYFKKEAIEMSYEFLTKELKIERRKIRTSVFSGDNLSPFDEESYNILKKIGFAEEKIFRCGRKENFWGPTGKSGPCGRTVEFYVGNMEIWNLVFNEYYCKENGEFEDLKIPGVDTGMGLERLAAVLQDKKNIFETDLFAPIIDILERNSEKKDIRAMRIIADHLKAAIFLSSERIEPSNKERGYVLRRLIRRFSRYGRLLGLKNEIYPKLIGETIRMYGDVYPEVDDLPKIEKVIMGEIADFEKTLGRGLREFEKFRQKGKIGASEAFFLYETYGFPFELTRELAKEQNIKLKEEDFQREFLRHQQISRVGAEKKFGGHGIKNSKFSPAKIFEKNLGGQEIPNSKIAKFHTATHLLQAALRQVLGSEVKQMGSDINEERARFDFAFSRKLTPEEIKKTESLVNEMINDDLSVIMEEMGYEKAMEQGALAFFKEKYPERVMVYLVINESGKIYSKEICAGPHVRKTGELGKFQITREEAVGKGVRRIKAIIK